MIYRLATAVDAECLAELCWEHKNEFEPLVAAERVEFIKTSSEHLRHRLGSDLHCWVADDDGIVAHVFIHIVHKIPMPGRMNAVWGRVVTVRTIPGYRNQGVGGTLMEHVKTWSREHGLQELIVWPSKQSVSFYERAGFSSKNDVMELLSE